MSSGARIAELEALVTVLLSRVETLQTENAVLRAEVAALKSRGSKNSGNSSLPPSRDPAGLYVIHVGELRDLRQIAAYQGEMVMFVDTAYAAQSFHRGLIAEMATEGIAGIGRIDNHTPAVDHLHRLLD